MIGADGRPVYRKGVSDGILVRRLRPAQKAPQPRRREPRHGHRVHQCGAGL
jgi:hypothetical protein